MTMIISCFEEKNNVSMDGDSGQEGDEEIFSYENFDHEKPLCKTQREDKCIFISALMLRIKD